MRLFSFLVAIVLAGTIPSTSIAGFSLEIQMASVDISSFPTSIGVDVYAFTNLGDPQQPITGFDLRFDVQGPSVAAGGQGLPSGITQSTDFITNSLLIPSFTAAGTSEIPNSPGGSNRDFYINGDNGIVSTYIDPLPTKTKLFTMNFDIASGTSPGVYAIKFVQRNDVYAQSPAFPEISGIAYTNGGINITAVPEPSSLGIAGIALGAFAIRCWKRKRKAVGSGHLLVVTQPRCDLP